MKIDRRKLELAMARACMNSADLPTVAGLPRATVQNAVVGKGVRPATLNHLVLGIEFGSTRIKAVTIDNGPDDQQGCTEGNPGNAAGTENSPRAEVLFPNVKFGNNTFDPSRFAVAAVNGGNRKTWHILLPTFQFGSNSIRAKATGRCHEAHDLQRCY